MNEKAQLAAADILKIYKNGLKDVRAVNGLSFEVKRGETIAVVGQSGAGKSTLLHLLGGLDRPTAGKVMLDGVDMYGLSDRERAAIRNRTIGFVFQFYHLLPEFSALENVMLPVLINAQRTKAERLSARDKAADILKAVGLGRRSWHKPGELSGGESQRVAIARALVNEPEMLLCDEPTGNLDSKTSDAIYDLIFEIKARHGMTLIIVTHDENISSRIKRILRIRDGKLAE
jgi:lipoprotein-releasing system ATP-binding protein